MRSPGVRYFRKLPTERARAALDAIKPGSIVQLEVERQKAKKSAENRFLDRKGCIPWGENLAGRPGLEPG